MKDEGRQPWFLLVLFALLGVPWVSKPATPGAVATAVQAGVKSEVEKGTAEKGCQEGERVLKEVTAVYPSARVETIIATVPDPYESIMDYGFDRSVSAVRRAAAEAGYQADRYWLPWLKDAGKKRGNDGGKAEDDCHKRVPGRLLFRKGDGVPDKLLQVLLVEETASWGVAHDAFQEALRESYERAPTEWVRVVGPTFSGSTASIRAGLEESDKERLIWPGVRIVNGSATSEKLESTLSRGKWGCLLGLDPCVWFESLIVDDWEMRERFFEYVISQKILEKNQNIIWDSAIFIEMGTTYGESFYAGFGGENKARPLLVVKYPAHISRLRTEREKQRKRLGEKSQDGAGIPPRVLELALGREDDAQEMPPSLSSKSMHSDELVLHQGILEMCRQEIRWVGVVATDTIDTLYLSQEIKRLCPNVRLFFFDADVLRVHPEYSEVLDGSVVISPYPLLAQNRAWAYPFDPFEVSTFASTSEQGTFNAVLKLLGEHEKMREHAAPFWDSEQNKPVWITAIGNGEPWPIRVIDDAGGHQKIKLGREAQWMFNAPSQWKATVIVLSLIVVWLCASYWASRLRPQKRHPALMWIDVSGMNALMLLFALVSIMLAYAVVVLTYWIDQIAQVRRAAAHAMEGTLTLLVEWYYQFGVRKDYIAILGFGASLLALVAMVITVVDVMMIKARPWPRMRTLYLIVQPIFIVAVIIYLFAIGGPRIDNLELIHWILFRERTGNLTSGISILTPLVFLAGAAFFAVVLYLRHRETVKSACPMPSLPEVDLPEAVGWRCAYEALRRSIERLGGSLAGLIVASLLTLLVLGMSWSHAETLEGLNWDRALMLILMISIFFGLASFFGFVSGWRHLHVLLQRLVSLPLTAAFRSLPRRYGEQMSGLILARPPEMHELALSLRRLRALPVPQEGVLHSAARDLQVDLRTMEEDLAKDLGAGSNHAETMESDTYKQMTATATKLLAVLAPQWKNGVIPHELDKDGNLKEGKPEHAWLRAAESFVATVFAGHIFHVLRLLRRLLTIAIGVAMILLATVVSYPFERRAAFLWAIEVCMVVIVITALWVFVRMEQSEILSHIDGTKPGEVSYNRAFFLKIFFFAVIPIFAVVAADVPAVGKLVFGMILPLLKVVGG